MGKYGSGKSFLLQLARNNALSRNYLVANADLSPERRLTGPRGQGLKLYRELIASLSTRARPEGGALTLVLDRWISAAQARVAEAGAHGEPPLEKARVFGAAPVNLARKDAIEQQHGQRHGQQA